MARRRLVGMAALLYVCALVPALIASAPPPAGTLDRELAAALATAGFTGTISRTYQARIEANLGRPIDPNVANITAEKETLHDELP